MLVWTCNTCARFCGVGGKEAAEAVAKGLSEKGFDVAGPVSVSASCLMSKVGQAFDPDCDAVLALCCDVGAGCVKAVSGKHVVNPVRTLGVGYLDGDGVPRLFPRSHV